MGWTGLEDGDQWGDPLQGMWREDPGDCLETDVYLTRTDVGF